MAEQDGRSRASPAADRALAGRAENPVSGATPARRLTGKSQVHEHRLAFANRSRDGPSFRTRVVHEAAQNAISARSLMLSSGQSSCEETTATSHFARTHQPLRSRYRGRNIAASRSCSTTPAPRSRRRSRPAPALRDGAAKRPRLPRSMKPAAVETDQARGRTPTAYRLRCAAVRRGRTRNGRHAPRIRAPRPLCGRRPVTQTVVGILLLDEA